jgi:tetratricopeptide (TPR) repeat protein
MGDKPPRYLPEAGSAALARRLRALLAGGMPAACPVYVGLRNPGELSSRHAEATHLLAQGLVDRAVDGLPHFNTRPAPIFRILVAASWGRSDAMDSKLERFPTDLASKLWQQVAELIRDPAQLTVAERRCASDVMLRLGYVRHAAELLNMSHAQPATFVFSPDCALEELQVLRRSRHKSEDLERLALSAAEDPRLSADIRMRMATFVVVRNGQRRADTPDLHRAAELALAAMNSLDAPPFARSLAEQTVFRANAFVPFVSGNSAETLAILDKAMECQLGARPTNDRETLTWTDHAFPLFQTIARTHLVIGDADKAITATERLVELSPNDERTWDIHGQALVEAGRLEEALVAYGRLLQLGGHPVARAAFHLAWIHQRLGNHGDAAGLYELSQRIDPTAPVVNEALNEALSRAT